MALRNVLFLGLVSFFADISAEMVYPLIPLYLSGVFGATPALVGLVEGLAESAASLLKVLSGYLSDRFERKKALAFTGYATGLLYKLGLLLAASWPGVLLARVVDRLGKGLRTAPRDLMVAQSAREGQMGRAFGLHKALDMAGASLGILLAYLLLSGSGGQQSYRQVFLLSIIPLVLGLLMFLFIKEQRYSPAAQRPPIFKALRQLDTRLRLYLLVVVLFTLGNSSNAFLLLRARSLGFSARDAILLYFVYNLSAALLSLPLGRLSDKVGRKGLLVAGYLSFSLVYLGFALAFEGWQLWAIFLLYGLHTALITGVERAFIAELAPQRLKGSLLGLHATLQGLALLPASLIAGLLWTGLGATAPFSYGALMSLAAALLLLFFLTQDKAVKA